MYDIFDGLEIYKSPKNNILILHEITLGDLLISFLLALLLITIITKIVIDHV